MNRDVVEVAAAELCDVIAANLARLANGICGRPVAGSPEWLADREVPAGLRASRLREWHLVKIAICVAADVGPVGDVINARLYGASWQQIGDALGVSRQAAHERWGKVCDRSTVRLDSEAEVLVAAGHARASSDVDDGCRP